MKTCNQCKKEKKLLDYSKDRSTKDGLKNKCKDCERQNRGTKSSGRKNINSLVDANFWLQQNHPRYEIISWGGSSSKNSVFFDSERNVEFEYSFTRFKDKIERFPDRIFCATKEELALKTKETFQKRYGTNCALQVKQFKQKHQETMLKNWNETNPMKVPELQMKQIQSLKQEYGVENPILCEAIYEKQKSTMIDKYGAWYPYQIKQFINVASQKSKQTKIEKGLTKVHKNKTLSEWAKELDVSYSFLQKLVAAGGLDAIDEVSPIYNSIETKIAKLLNDLDIEFVYNKSVLNSKFRPDFQIEQQKMIIECDGLFWHSDKIIENINYHVAKKKFYDQCGYVSLFFREDEIKDKFAIVSSIIKNKLKMNSQKIYARKCTIEDVSKVAAKDFFNQNHLMGNGQGRTYSLKLDEKIVAALQVRWMGKKEEKNLEFSRFCTRINSSVVGGFSKLVKYVIQKENPNTLTTFIDRRYGEGNYLSEFGFKKETEYPSFRWTDGKKSVHRRRFKFNTGYDYGLVKIWDCGQAKYVVRLR